MKKKYSILLILIILMTIYSCEQKTSDSDISDQVEVITNEKPTNPAVTLKFEEELTLSEKGWWPANVIVNDKGNIYVFGEVEMSIHKYDAEGNLLLKKEFPKGQGPGDFMFMDPNFSSDGRIFIYDKQQHRISILDKNCELIESYKTESAKYLLRLDSKDNMYFWVGKSSPDKHTDTLTKFSSAGKNLFEIFEYEAPRPEFDEKKSMFTWPLYFQRAIYKLDSHDNVYYCLITEYRINKVSHDGRILRSIVKKGQTRKVTERDIEEISPQVEERQDIRTVFIPPENVPCIADFFILENDYLLVITHENDYEEDTLAGDLFDKTGVYLNRVDVPKYYLWNIDTYSAIIKKKALYKDNYFYTIITDDLEENFYVKRYKISMINLK